MSFSGKKKGKSLAEQVGALRSIFPTSKVHLSHRRLVWTNMVRPSPLSKAYEIKISYELGSSPEAYVISPILALAPGKTSLPHVYNSETQKLCLYHPSLDRWRPSSLIALSILPWALEWLLHYEIWLVEGVWFGGGVDHPKDSAP